MLQTLVLVILSSPPTEKRHVWRSSRQHRGIPIPGSEQQSGWVGTGRALARRLETEIGGTSTVDLTKSTTFKFGNAESGQTHGRPKLPVSIAGQHGFLEVSILDKAVHQINKCAEETVCFAKLDNKMYPLHRFNSGHLALQLFGKRVQFVVRPLDTERSNRAGITGHWSTQDSDNMQHKTRRHRKKFQTRHYQRGTNESGY